MALPPVVAEWMEGCSHRHPLAPALTDSSWPSDWEDVERILQRLEAAQPLRLATKKRDFRSLTNIDRYSDLVSELAVAAWLTDHDVAFEFGKPGEPQPDLVLPTFGFGIEITRRRRNPDRDLQDAIRRGVWAAVPASERRSGNARRARSLPTPLATVTGHPITIRKGVLDAVAGEVEDAVRRGDRHVFAVVRPPRDGHPAVTVTIDLQSGGLTSPRVVHDERWVDLTVPMRDIEDLVRAALTDRRKRSQGDSMPTVLLMDVTRLSSLLWLRSPSDWADRLGNLLAPDHSFIGVGLARLSGWPRLGLGIGPRATADTRDGIVRWADQMGMRSTTSDEPNPFRQQRDTD